MHIFDQGTTKMGEFKSQLSYQTRCISIFENNEGFAMGCIEGRVAIEYFAEIGNKSKQQKQGILTNHIFPSFILYIIYLLFTIIIV